MPLFYAKNLSTLQVSGISNDRDGCYRPFRAPGAFFVWRGTTTEAMKCRRNGVLMLRHSKPLIVQGGPAMDNHKGGLWEPFIREV